MARWSVRVFTLSLLVFAISACSQLTEAPPPDGGIIVITAGSPAPDAVGGVLRAMSNLKDARTSIGGSSTNPVSFPGLGCTADDPMSVILTITYTVSGNQESRASFDLFTTWTYDGTEFIGTDEETITLPAVQRGGPRVISQEITLSNAQLLGQGTTTIHVEPFNLQTNEEDPGGLQLRLDDSSKATIHVQFIDCQAANTPPALTVSDITEEATSSGGARVGFVVTVYDLEDDPLPTPVCMADGAVVEKGDQFAIGATEVTCTVTDSGGLSDEASFLVYVQDTIAPEFTSFPEGATIVATNIDGYALDLSEFETTAADYGPDGAAGGEVSPPVEIECKVGSEPAQGYQIAIGQTATVACTATDSASYRAPVKGDGTQPAAPNSSEARTFTVSVTLDVSADCGFEPPLRMNAPYSAHKANSTIPHKVCAPAYRDGTPATDLADGLRLVLRAIGSAPATDAIEANEFAAGSTEWRLAGDHYIFNLKSDRNWAAGQYETTVSFQDVILATTEFALRK